MFSDNPAPPSTRASTFPVTKAVVRIGFIGGGMMAQIGHLPFYLADSRCEVVAVAEERPTLVEALSRRLGPERVVPDYRYLLERPDIEGIVISAPRPATGPLTLEALEAGKHVFAEKPMALTADQAHRLAEAARVGNLIYAVGFMKRYDPGVQAARTLLSEATASRKLGRLLLARLYGFSKSYATAIPAHIRPSESRAVRYAAWPVRPDWLSEHHSSAYQWFVNAASHNVNLAGYFFPDSLEAVAARAPSDGSVVAMLQAGSTPVVLEIARTEAGRWLEGAEFLFERGRIGVTIPSPMAVDRVGEVTLDDLDAGIKAWPVETKTGWCFALQAKGFVDALTGGSKPLTSGQEGLADMRLTEAIWRHIEDRS